MVNPDLAPGCQVGEEVRVGRAGVASLLFAESWSSSGALYVDVKVSAVASPVYQKCFLTYLLPFLFRMSSISGLPRFIIAFGVTALLIENLPYPMMGGMSSMPSGMCMCSLLSCLCLEKLMQTSGSTRHTIRP